MKNKTHIATCFVITVSATYSFLATKYKIVLHFGSMIALATFSLVVLYIFLILASILYQLLYNFFAKEFKEPKLSKNRLLDFLIKPLTR